MPLLLFIGLSARRMRRCLCFSDASGSVCVSGQMRKRWRIGNRCSIPWTRQYGTDPSQNSTSSTAHWNRHSVDSVRDVCSQSIVIRSMWHHSLIPTSHSFTSVSSVYEAYLPLWYRLYSARYPEYVRITSEIYLVHNLHIPQIWWKSVSYTHLTLPTIYSV